MAAKILIITDAWRPQVNGVVRTYEHLAAALEKLGYQVVIIGPDDFPWRIKMPGYSEIPLVLFPGRRMRNLLQNHTGASIHIGTEGPLGWAARRLCRRWGWRFTTAYHTQFPAYVAKRMGGVLPFLAVPVQRCMDNLIRYFHKDSAGVVITTPSLAAELRERGYHMPLFCMNRGVPTELFKPGARTLFQDATKPIALYVGRVAIEKNIEAFLTMHWPGMKIVVGDGPSLKRLHKQYPDVLFAGRRTGNDLVAYYQAADIFVFPSRTDTFGIVLLEALACGLPVAAYNVVGPRDIIDQSFLGALRDDLAMAAEHALHAPADAMTRHHYIAEHYSWTAAAARFIEILRETNTLAFKRD